jgi:hypothetical protein
MGSSVSRSQVEQGSSGNWQWLSTGPPSVAEQALHDLADDDADDHVEQLVHFSIPAASSAYTSAASLKARAAAMAVPSS